MSIEIRNGECMFRTELLEDIQEEQPNSNGGAWVLRYNPLHDLESIWWIMAYFVINKDIKLACKSTKEHERLAELEESEDDRVARISAQSRFAERLFIGHDERASTFIVAYHLKNQLKNLHPAMRRIGAILNQARFYLCEAYTDAERQPSRIDYGRVKSNNLYAQLQTCLSTTIKLADQELYSIRLTQSIHKAADQNQDAIVRSTRETSNKRKTLNSRASGQDGDEGAGRKKPRTQL